MTRSQPPIIATVLANIYQKGHNLQSTKTNIKIISPIKTELDIDENKYFNTIMDNVKTHEVCEKIIPFNTNRKVCIDLTGSFPQKKSVSEM